MKKNLFTCRTCKFILLFVSVCFIKINSFAWSASYPIGIYTQCSTDDPGYANCLGHSIGGYTWRVESIVGNSITFKIKPCSGSFVFGGTFYLKEGCSTNIGTTIYQVGDTAEYLTISMTGNNSHEYFGWLVHNSGNNFYSTTPPIVLGPDASNPKPFMSVSPMIENVGNGPAGFNINVSANLVDWTAEKWDVSFTTHPTWLTIAGAGGTGNGNIGVTYNLYTGQESAYIRITGDSGVGYKDVLVNQNVPLTLSVSPSNQNVAYTAGSTSFTISSDVYWSITDTSSWCSIYPYNGYGSQTVTVTYTKNVSSQQVATFHLSGSGVSTKTFTVTQSANPIVVSPTFTTVNSGADSIPITITATGAWTAASDQTWCTLYPASGTGNSIVYAIVTENVSTTTQRQVNVTITSGANTSGTNIIQDMTRTFTVLNNGFPSVSHGFSSIVNFNNASNLNIVLFNAGSGNKTRIYQNNGSFGFTEISNSLNFSIYGFNWGDYDNDDIMDFLSINQVGYNGQLNIYKNQGGGVFTNTVTNLMSTTWNAACFGDYNNDNFLDIFCSSTSSSDLFLNDGLNNYVMANNQLPGLRQPVISWVDYNNDGNQDICLTGYDNSASSKFYLLKNCNHQSFKTTLLNMPALFGTSLDFGDFDNDGYFDLVYGGENANATQTFCNIYRNNNGVFNNINANLQGISYGSCQWADLNNDGFLDLIISGTIRSYFTKIYFNDGHGNFIEQKDIIPQEVAGGTISLGDLDNDGDIDILITYGSKTKILRNNTFKNNSHLHNTAPTIPINLSSNVDSSTVVLHWNKATDAETPYNGLSYNVRMGTSINGVDIVSPMANLTTGFHKIYGMGNAQLDTLFIIKNLLAGKYYWSVQAIDNGNLGSHFAPADSFLIAPSPLISINYDTICSNQVTTISYNGSAGTGAQYNWNFGGATVISGTNGGPYLLTWSMSGFKQITLTIIASGDTSNVISSFVYVKAVPLAPSVTTTVTYCQNATATQLTATGSNLLWYITATGGIGSSTAPTPSTTNTGTTNYYVSQTITGCESPRASINVVINATPTAPSITTPVNYCINDIPIALSASGSSLLWYTTSTGGTGSAGAPTPTTSSIGTTTYYVTQTFGACESPRAAINVVVHPLPSTPVISQVGSDLNSNATSGNQWYNDNGIISGAMGQVYTPVMTSNYYDIVTDANGCVSDTSNKIYILITGISNLSDNKNIYIYPNPVTNNLQIQTALQIKSIDVSDITGRLLYTTTAKTINCSSFAKGVYFITLTTENGKAVKKFVKE